MCVASAQRVGEICSFGRQHNFQEHWESVCWAFAPTEETQKAAQDYFDEILANVSVTEHTRVVTVHLRRGDYVGKAGIHGLLTVSERTLPLCRTAPLDR